MFEPASARPSAGPEVKRSAYFRAGGQEAAETAAVGTGALSQTKPVSLVLLLMKENEVDDHAPAP